MMKIVAFLLALTFPATAQIAPSQTGTNMPPDFYPHSPCLKPAKIARDGTARTSTGSTPYWAPTDVNVPVANFNKATSAFNACIKIYVDRSRYDTQYILALVNGAVASVQGTEPPAMPATMGNLPLGFYPGSPCIKPDQAALGNAPGASDQRAMIGYNQRVKIFNQQASVFNACIKTYVDNGRRDIATVQNRVQAAVTDANAPLTDSALGGDFMTERRR